jgi:hypothetical protein
MCCLDRAISQLRGSGSRVQNCDEMMISRGYSATLSNVLHTKSPGIEPKAHDLQHNYLCSMLTLDTLLL